MPGQWHGPAPDHPQPARSSRDNKLLASIEAVAAQALRRNMHRMSLQRGQTLIEAEGPLTRIWFPESCVVSLSIRMENGSSPEVAAIGPEGAVGHDALLGLERSLIQASVQVPGDALCIGTRELFASAEQNPSLRMALWHNLAVIHAQTMQLAACYALHPARARLARFLLMTQDRTGGAAVHLTQELLAELLGVQRTTVTAAALVLMEQGLILYHRGRIDICDRPGLEAAACECYRAIRQLVLPVSHSRSSDSRRLRDCIGF
jgi:CRP-like cAMP-binding protein